MMGAYNAITGGGGGAAGSFGVGDDGKPLPDWMGTGPTHQQQIAAGLMPAPAPAPNYHYAPYRRAPKPRKPRAPKRGRGRGR